jgi:organic radical activating enzyme
MKCNYCDTDFEKSTEITMYAILRQLKEYPCKNIVWTGGEPTIQLTDGIVRFFKKEGYFQSIETNGSKVITEGLDYISVSPKVSNAILSMALSNYGWINEYRFPMKINSPLPCINNIPKAKAYYLSPIFEGDEKRELNDFLFERVVELVKQNPIFRLSIQNHKLWNIK